MYCTSQKISVTVDAQMVHDLIQLGFNLVKPFKGLFSTLDLGSVTTSQLTSLEFGNKVIHFFRIASTARRD